MSSFTNKFRDGKKILNKELQVKLVGFIFSFERQVDYFTRKSYPMTSVVRWAKVRQAAKGPGGSRGEAH